MPSNSRIIRKITVSTNAGSDGVVEIEDCREVYGDEFPIDTEPCRSTRATAGQCEYSWRDNWRRCIYCGRASGLV